MGRRNTGVFIAILVAFALFIFGLGMYVKYMSSKSSVKKEDELLRDSLRQVALLNDLTIYWIGDVPEDMTYLNGRILKVEAGTLSRENMPMKSPDFHTIDYDENGNVVNENIPVKYTSDLIIIINQDVNLTDKDFECISDCVINNEVPLLVIGGDAIKNVKTHFMQSTMGYETMDSYLYSLKEGQASHVLNNEELLKGGKRYSIEILRYILDTFGEEPEEK